MLQFSELPRPVIRHANGLWRRRWTIIAVAWFFALAGWFIVWMIPDKFESRAQVYVKTETILEPVLSGFTARPDYSERVEIMRLQLMTRPNVEQIIYRAGLDKTIKAKSPARRLAELQSMIDWVAGDIVIDSPRDMYFIISYRHNDPETARAVVAALVNLLIEQDLGASFAEDQAARRRLDLQVEQYDEKLSANERAVAEFRKTHAAELAASQGAARAREQKESELARVRDELARTKGRILSLQNLLSSTPRDARGDELSALRLQLAELRSRYKDTHPDIRGVLARIDQLETAERSSLTSNPEYVRLQGELSVARDSVAALEGREAALREELVGLDMTLSAAPEVEAELSQIIREYEQTQKTYEELLARRDRLNLTKELGVDGRGVEYQVFEQPQTALTPSSPPRMMLILGVLALALGAGVGAGLLRSLLDKTYTQAVELKEAFGLPILGAISEAPSAAVIAARRRDWRLMGAALAALAVICLGYIYFAVMQIPGDRQTTARHASVDELAIEGAL